LPEPVEYGEPISSQATTSPSIRQDQVPQRLFRPRPPELFCAAELFFSHFSGGGVVAKRPGKTRASDAWGTESPPERTERIQFKVSTDEIAAIDEFRFQTRMPNRATAIRELLRRGLGAPKTERG
jgi:hypothetical protein